MTQKKKERKVMEVKQKQIITQRHRIDLYLHPWHEDFGRQIWLSVKLKDGSASRLVWLCPYAMTLLSGKQFGWHGPGDNVMVLRGLLIECRKSPYEDGMPGLRERPLRDFLESGDTQLVRCLLTYMSQKGKGGLFRSWIEPDPNPPLSDFSLCNDDCLV